MFLRLLIYRIKILLKCRSLLFWTFAFPVVLGLMFTLAFSGLDKMNNLETTKVGIVSTDEQKTSTFETILSSIKDEDNHSVYQSSLMTKQEAINLLESNKIAGYYEITTDDIALSVNQNGVPQILLKEFLNQYTQQVAEYESLMPLGITPAQKNSDSMTDFVTEPQHSSNFSIKSFYFFTLVAMAIMYGFMWGLKNANDQQANQSANGIRLCMGPQNKMMVVTANLLASLVLFLIQNLIILAIFHFVYAVDFGNRWLFILLIYLLSSFATLSFGTLIGNVFSKKTFQQKIGIGIGVSSLLSFFAGMMGSQSIKYWIDLHVPLLSKINLVNLISESLYQLFYYHSLTPFYLNLVWITGFALIFTLLNYFYERKIQYDHL